MAEMVEVRWAWQSDQVILLESVSSWRPVCSQKSGLGDAWGAKRYHCAR